IAGAASVRSLVTLALLGLAILMLLVSVFFSLPSNVLSDRGKVNAARVFSVDLAPQGWGFFTKPPSDSDLFYYDGNLQSVMETPQGRADNLLGLSRTQRAQGPEGGALLTPLAEEDWFKCETGEDLEECYESLKASTTEPIRADNTFKHPTLCGKVVIAQAEPVPWSYRDLYEQTHIPEGMIEMQVTCEN
ncbi:MAG: SdpA family antimicrobial peptide system protein, partial [Bifidobacterium crudilactis]|nr:SdpA family antimicrobial peptide system protein [Bifidobacterium crudilactis]